MKLAQTCICGAHFSVEDDDPRAAEKSMSRWQKRHQCNGTDPWRRSTASTVAGDFTFGFTRDYTLPSDDKLQFEDRRKA